MKKYISMFLCLTLIMGILAGCGSKSDAPETTGANTTEVTQAPLVDKIDEEQKGGKMEAQAERITVAVNSTSINVSPFAPSSPANIFKIELYPSLFYSPKFGCSEADLQPWIAKSFEKMDGNKYKIEIFDYVKDCLGNPITIDDVIWSINKSIEIGQFVDGGTNIKSMEKIDEYNMIMEMTNDAPNTFSMVVTSERMYIVNQQWWENASDEEKQNNPACPGPYTVKAFMSGSSTTLVANDAYWQTDAAMNDLVAPAFRNVKEMVITAVTEASMRVIALENNEVDIASVGASDLDMFYDFKNNQSKDGWCVNVSPLTFVHSLFPNMEADNILGSNPELRKAIFYAIDPNQLIIASGNNSLNARALTSSVAQDYAGYQQAWNDRDYYSYDPAKAAEHLKNAGYAPGEVTIRLLSSASIYNDSVRSVLISQLNAIGINVENVAVEAALFSSYKNDPTIWDLMIDLKSANTGHVASYYSFCYAPDSYQNGGVNFCKDDALYAMVDAVMADASDENIQAVEQYLYDNAIVYGMYCNGVVNVGQKGIQTIGTTGSRIIPVACVFAEDYKPAG